LQKRRLEKCLKKAAFYLKINGGNILKKIFILNIIIIMFMGIVLPKSILAAQKRYPYTDGILKDYAGYDELIQALYFGQPGVYIWDSNTMNNYLQYVSLQMLFSNFVTQKSYTWKYIRPKVYIHGYGSKGVILECFVRPTKFSDISYTSDKYALAKQYALALAKEIVGRTRSRFTIAGAPYQLDGAALIAEAQQEKADVIARIIPPIRVY
jgi:hypothetical protein